MLRQLTDRNCASVRRFQDVGDQIERHVAGKRALEMVNVS
jgi:hypothetical protein